MVVWLVDVPIDGSSKHVLLAFAIPKMAKENIKQIASAGKTGHLMGQ